MNKAPVVLAIFAIIVLAWCFSPASSGSAEISQAAGSYSGAGASTDPPAAFYVHNLRREFALPALHTGSDDPALQIARDTQVFQRAQLLKIDGATADASWANGADVVAADRKVLPTLRRRPLRQLAFNGTRLSQLGALVATAGPSRITVVSKSLLADTPLIVTQQNVVINFSGAVIEVGAQPPVWLIALVHARNVAIIGAKINGGTNGFLVDSGSDIDIQGNDVQSLTENGIVVTGPSSGVDIHANHLRHLGRAGIMLDGPVAATLVEDNEIDHLRGHSNWNAGVVLTSRGGDIAADPDTFFLPDHYWVVTGPLVQRLQNPHDNVIMDNTIRLGLSSGIYDDGAVANIFLENRIEGNSKEGICFDNGATASVFAGNLVAGNGKRWGQPDADLALDSVLSAGRAADGTSVAKLPGVSIDNALYNEILANDVVGNFGGGVKMVRTALFNVVLQNVVIDNNIGENSRYHFFGVELGSAPADKPVDELNFVGSSGNIIIGNMIRGRHYAGIFLGPGSVQNDVLDNQITGAEAAAVESATHH